MRIGRTEEGREEEGGRERGREERKEWTLEGGR